jgi:ABC-type dipeptide/oligopeptide/nickel transport system permease component
MGTTRVLSGDESTAGTVRPRPGPNRTEVDPGGGRSEPALYALAGVLSFVVRRLLLGAVVVAAVSFLSWAFFATAASPIWSFYADPKSPQVLEIVRRAHLHDPLLTRYWLWVKGLFTGQGFGRTAVENAPVGQIVWPALRVSVELIAAAFVVVVALSVLLGALSARRRSPIAAALRTFSYVAWSVPAFLLAELALQGIVRVGPPWHLPLALGGAPTGGVRDWFSHMTLPILVVAAGLVGVYSRYVRSAMIGALAAPYTTVARGKGLPERRVVLRHALRNSLGPFVAVLSLDFGAVFTASLAADFVFQLHGLASIFLGELTGGSDPFVIQAELVVVSVLVVFTNLVGDLVGAWLDPRARLV